MALLQGSTGCVPFPCVVYTRERPDRPYIFSHYCSSLRIQKKLPPSLRVRDLRAWDPQPNRQGMQNACFLVLVAGDVAQCISLRNATESRVSFLFTGSQYAMRDGNHDRLATEFHDNCVPLRFYGTMAVYDTTRAQFSSLVPIKSSVALLPREILESHLPVMCNMVSSCVQKSAATSLWVTDTGDSYNELTMRFTVPRTTRGF